MFLSYWSFCSVKRIFFSREAMWSRFLPQTTVLRRLLDDGVLGAPRQVSADFGSRFPFEWSIDGGTEFQGIFEKKAKE